MNRLASEPIEHVLLCDSDMIQKIMGDNVLIPISKNLINSLNCPTAYWFGARNIIETNSDYVQLVSYVIIEHNSHILCYQRGTDSSEQRLKEKYSIGLGGHISLKDTTITDGSLDVMKTIETGATREVQEELELHTVSAKIKLGLLHSRLNPVDSVHCGFVELWRLESDDVVIREASLKTLGFKSLTELAAMQGFETWSTLLIQYLSSTSQHIQ